MFVCQIKTTPELFLRSSTQANSRPHALCGMAKPIVYSNSSFSQTKITEANKQTKHEENKQKIPTFHFSDDVFQEHQEFSGEG